MIDSSDKFKLLNEIEDLRASLTKLYHTHASFTHAKIIEQSQKLDEKIIQWQKRFPTSRGFQ
jgi:hypothetical protein